MKAANECYHPMPAKLPQGCSTADFIGGHPSAHTQVQDTVPQSFPWPCNIQQYVVKPLLKSCLASDSVPFTHRLLAINFNVIGSMNDSIQDGIRNL